MKIEKGKTYRRISNDNESFTIGNIYESPANGIIIDDNIDNTYVNPFDFEEVKKNNMIKVIGLDGKEVQQKEQEKPIEFVSVVRDIDIVESMNNAKDCEFVTLLANRNRLNKYDLMQDDKGIVYLGYWNSGLKQIPELKPIELTHFIKRNGVDEEPIFIHRKEELNSGNHRSLMSKIELIMHDKYGNRDVIKVTRYDDVEWIYLGHWNDGILPTFD